MPSDIRSFFGKGSQGSNSSKTSTSAPKKTETDSQSRKRRSRKVVDDSEEDDEVETKPAPKPKHQPSKKQKVEEPTEKPTTTSEYFSSSRKGRPSKETNTESKPGPKANETPDKSPGRTKTKPEKNGAAEKEEASPRAKRKRPSSGAAKVIDDDDNLGGDDIFATDFRKAGKGGDDDYQEEDDDKSDFENVPVKPEPVSSKKDVSKPAKSPRKGHKRKSEELAKDEEEESEDIMEKPKKRQPRKPAQKSSPKKPKQTAQEPESKEIQGIFDSIPIVHPPTPPTESKKFNFAAAAQRSQPPPGAGTKEIPVGAENCLAGLSFVFTGLLDTLGREEGQQLVKRYGGRSMSAPSSKTSYVVLGNDAGPKKLETIRKYNLKTIDEDGLFELIKRLPANGGDGKAAIEWEAKKKVEEQKIKEMADEIDREEKKNATPAKSQATASHSAGGPSEASKGGAKGQPAVDNRLWTTKYAPSSLNMVCGNKANVEKLQSWLRNWRSNAKFDFKKPGKDGTGLYRSVIISGPPGIGKTTAAHLVAKLEGFDVHETNASDTRSKKLLEEGLRGVLDTTSLQGYFAGEGKKVESTKKKLVLIMDEVDGMSAGDRGGVGALAAVAKKTRIPIILICNDRKLPKMKPFDYVSYNMPFRRPTAEQIRARLSTICYREGLKIPPQVLSGLIEGTHADIRQVINMMSTIKLDQQDLSFDQGKDMTKAWEKHVILKPWDIAGKILSPEMFRGSATLNDKIELYFNDHEFSYLMLQENYLKTRPVVANTLSGKQRSLKLLELADNAAESISDGDLVDRMIHGSQQQWSLMPTHAAFSFVRPASFVCGSLTEGVGFTSWLGNNSKQGKMSRQVKEIQGHMRLRASGDRHEIRQQYMPALWDQLIRKLQDDGKDAVDSVIDLMDSYFLTRDDWDSILELGLGPMSDKDVNIESQTKAAFTRIYNQRSHPLPFMKASSVVAPKKTPKEKPDLEEAVDESDEGEEVLGEEEVKGEEGSDTDLKKDKYVKAPKKKKGAATSKAKPKAKPKKTKGGDDDDDILSGSEDEKPKKGRKGRKPKGKA